MDRDQYSGWRLRAEDTHVVPLLRQLVVVLAFILGDCQTASTRKLLATLGLQCTEIGHALPTLTPTSGAAE